MSKRILNKLPSGHTVGMELDIGQPDWIGFNAFAKAGQPKARRLAKRRAREEYIKPGHSPKGIMLVLYIGTWFGNDGVNPNTGEMFTCGEVSDIENFVDKLHIVE